MTDGHCATDNETIYVGTAATTACSDTTGMGGPSTPVCSAAYGISLAKTGSKSVVLVRGALTPPSPGSTTTIAVPAPLTIVGKNNAIIAPATGADALLITSGDITLRNLTIQGNAAPATGIGISAAPAPGSTVTLHMDTCVIANNPGGGILLNGAAFDIKNTTVTGNGPNTTTGWGGISVQNAPASGPTTFNLVSIKDNGQIGLTCAGSIASTDTGTGVLATGNVGGIQITSICGITACTPASTTCGAQSTPQ
jgi:hypothetical protein